MMLSLVSPVPRRAASHDKIHNLASQTAAEVGGGALELWGACHLIVAHSQSPQPPRQCCTTGLCIKGGHSPRTKGPSFNWCLT